MSDTRDCRKCGASLVSDNIKAALWIPPYCPACWPSRCPHCNVKEFYWSKQHDHPRCDSGCYMNGAEFPPEN